MDVCEENRSSAKNVIYCFSGTGNSMNAALKIATAQKGTDIISMRCDPQTVPANNASAIGFIFPVYHWSLPDAAKDFIQKVCINPDSYIFAVATCGGWPVNALNDFVSMIRKKGGNVSYTRVHYTVANYVAEYEPFPNPRKKLPVAAIELEEIAADIAKRTINNAPKATIIKEFLRLIEKPFVKSLSSKDRHFIVSDDCISCSLCEKVCITGNIAMESGRPIFHNNCAQCMGCVAFCPKGALNYKNKTQKRTKYHHPEVSAKLLTFDKVEIK